jgi:hypothetical protein
VIDVHLRSPLLRFSIAAGECALAVTLLFACRDESKAVPSSSDAAVAAPPPTLTATTPVNALPIPSASIAAAVNPKGLPAYDGPVGSIEGTVYVTGSPAPDAVGVDFSSCPSGANVYKKLFREGPALPSGARPVADALVGVTGYTAFVAEQAPAVTLKFDDCSWGTRTVALTFGQRIELVNATRTIVAPTLDQAPSPALMVVAPEGRGDPVKIYPPHPGYFTMTDKIGATYSKVDVYVLLFPLHAVTSTVGHYRIDGIPIGKVDVSARLRAIGQEASQKVDVLAGVVQKVDLTLKYQPAKEAPPTDAGTKPKFIP